MSSSNSDDRGKRKSGSKSSGSYGMVLGRRIANTSDGDVDKARASFEQAVLDSPPPPSSGSQSHPEPKSESVHTSKAPESGETTEPDPFPVVEPSTTPSMRDSQVAPTAKEVGDATIALTASVDEICQALVLVFDKIEDLLKEVKTASSALAAVSRVLLMLLVAQVVVFGLMGFLVYRIESVVRSAEQNRVEQAQTSAELRKLVVGFVRLQQSAEATRRTVDEVAIKADESPKVEIVADVNKPGSAVVRIVPPLPKGGSYAPSKGPDQPPQGPASGGGPPPPLEIPIQLDKARPAPPDASP